MARCGPWMTIVCPADRAQDDAARELAQRVSPACMPRMQPQHIKKIVGEDSYFAIRGPGRPHRGRTKPRLAVAAAWLSDFRELSAPAVAEALLIQGEERSARRTATAYAKDGQRLLYKLGVLPWFLWEDGDVPVGWWNDFRFTEGLRAWYAIYVRPHEQAFAHLNELVKLAAEYDRLYASRTSADVARSILKSEQERYRRLQRKPSLTRLDQFQSSAGNNA